MSIFRSLKEKVTDDSTPLQERLFVLSAGVGIVTIATMIIIGIIAGESPLDLMILVACLFIYLSLAVLAVKIKKTDIFSLYASIVIILVMLPLTFFTGGGLYGGCPLWFVFCTLYVCLIVTGKKKYILLALDAVVATVCFILSYIRPELVIEHDRFTAYVDSYVSLIVVCAILSFLVGFEIWAFSREAEKNAAQKKEIEQLNAAQNRFFSSMSHEIRTPINTILGLNEMILREEISDEVAEDAKNIQAASRILLSVINDILDMSKIEAGKMDIVKTSYDTGKMLSEIVNMIWIRAKEKGLKFVVDVDPSMPGQLFSDEVRIKQILINLLNNAIKYTNEGSVTLSIHCRRTDTKKALVTYSVEDTGMGIKKESVPHLFDAFRREDSEKNKYIEGTGLGLSIVKQLVDLLGGEISVNSVYTKGSTFVVSIEQEISDERMIGRFDPEKYHKAGGRSLYHQMFEAPKAKVLVVDDNRANLLVAEKLLRATKVNVTTADSAEECLKLTVENRYDAIFMDHMMPVMDGIECMHLIRTQNGDLNKNTPIVALTANAGSENQALYKREGFDGYIVKPIDAEELERTLVNLLPESLITLNTESSSRFDSDSIVRESKRKVPLLITTDSVSDLPDEIIKQHGIPVLPYKVRTKNGLFTDGSEAKGDVIIRYMEDKEVTAHSESPTVEEYERFFAEQLSKAQHIIHIAMAKNSSLGFSNACEAALSFYNVRVIDSGHLSSGMGLMTLAAKELADNGQLDDEIIRDELEKKKPLIQTSFIVDNTEFLYRGGKLSERVHRFCLAFMVHPVIVLKNSSMKVGNIFLGSTEKARKSYIKKALKNPQDIDTSKLFITYCGMSKAELSFVKEEVEKIVKFDTIYFQKASPAISINCGPGTFGLLYSKKQA